MAKSNPLITICIPTYNRQNFLGETIQSVLDQTYKHFEIIIINDCSTDNTESIIKKFKDKRIRYIKNEKNSGYIQTMNKGTKLAKGEWIMHLSDDDRMRPKMLEKMITALTAVNNKEIGFVVPQTININAKGDVISIPSKQLQHKEYLILEPKEFIFNYTLYGRKIRDKYKFNTSFPSTLFNKRILVELGKSSEEVPVSHDVLIGSKVCLLYPVIIIDEPLFEYRVHENWGSSLNTKGTFLQEYTHFLSLLLQFVKEKRIRFSYDFNRYCYRSLIQYLFSLNGGLIRTAARLRLGYIKRLVVLREYIFFGISHNKSLLLSLKFYIVILASLLPRSFLIKAGRIAKQI